MATDAQDPQLFVLVRDLGVRMDRSTELLSGKIEAVARDVGDQIDDVNTAKTAAHKDLWAAIGALTADVEAQKQDAASFKGRIYGAMAALTVVVSFVVAAFVIADHLG